MQVLRTYSSSPLLARHRQQVILQIGDGLGGMCTLGGDFVYSNNPSSFTDPWDGYFTGTDLAFKANIADAPSNVPGPLPILGLAAAFGFSRKLRKRIKLHKGTDAVSTSTGS